MIIILLEQFYFISYRKKSTQTIALGLHYVALWANVGVASA